MNFQSISQPDFRPPLWTPKLLDKPSAWWGHVPFAFWVTEASKPRTLVELGTHHGISYAAFCEAVAKSGLATRCYAVDSYKGDEHAGFYGNDVYENLKAFHDQNYASFSVLIRSDFDIACPYFDDASIDLLHIDGLHTYDGVRHDFETWQTKLSAHAVVLFHDTNVRRDDFGVWRFFKELSESFPTFEFLHAYGLGVVAVGPEAPEAVKRLCELSESSDIAVVREAFSSFGSMWAGVNEAQIARDRLRERVQELERNGVEHEAAVARLSVERDTLSVGRDTLSAERDALASKVQTLSDALSAETRALSVERDMLSVECDTLSVERDTLSVERDTLSVERDTLSAERDKLSVERDNLRQTLEAMRAENETQRASIALHRNDYDALRDTLDGSEKLLAYVSERYKNAARKRKFRALRRRLRLAFRKPSVGRRTYELVSDSAFFEKNFYLASNPDVKAADFDPVEHYVKYGSKEGRDPSPFFLEASYRAGNPDVAASGLSAIEHYERYGRAEVVRQSCEAAAPVAEPPSASESFASTMNVIVTKSRQPLEEDPGMSLTALLPWPPRNPSNGVCAGMRRICIFSFYDPQGVVDDYVVFLLQKLGEFAEKIIFYSNGPLARDSEIKLHGIVDDVVLRPNVGVDVLAFKQGFERIAYNREGLYDEVLLVNQSCYGPVFPFSELFGEMEGRDCDFWGVSAHAEMTPNPLTGVGTLPYHLNSNFIAIRAGMLGSLSFRQYWDDMRVGPSYEEAIMAHEARFTEYFTKLGYKASVYLNKRSYGSHNPLLLNIDETLLDRNPLVERRAFIHDPRFFDHYAADLPRALSILAKTSDYNLELIWRSAVRQAELRTLNTNAALTSVLPDVRLKQNAPLPDNGAVAVCVHLYYVDMLEEILSFTDTIPVPYEFIATTDTEAKKAAIEQAVAGRKNIRNVIVRLVDRNRGRDMSSLFITCRDLFLDDRYGLVCRLHTKKSPQVAASRGNLFKRHQFENLLNSEGYTTNVLDMFHDKPWIGVAVPPVVQISYSHLGHIWYNNREKAEEMKKVLDLKAPFDPDTPVGAFGTMFWFRPRALHKLFAYPWEWTDYNAEPHHLDGGLAHVQERLICYVAQDAGYTTEQILSAHLAGWNYAMMEYKLQKLLAKLPNPDFSYQDRMLEQWCAAGYPRSPVSVLPSPAVDGSC